MPELPEVETVVRGLREKIIPARIENVVITPLGLNALGKQISRDDFISNLQGQSFESVERVGKFIIINLSATSKNNTYSLITHLRMTGKFLFRPNKLLDKKTRNTQEDFDNRRVYPQSIIDERYLRVMFELDTGTLEFHDKRRFGTLHLANPSKYPGIEKLGPDALTESFDPIYLSEKLANTTRAIYSILLDQTVVAGLGNIYVCEVLFKSKVHPQTPGNRLSAKSLESIVFYTKQILQNAIIAKGSTLRDYSGTEGERGEYTRQLSVYGKRDTTVGRKKYEVKKLKLNGRTVYFVPEVQRSNIVL